MATKKMLTIPGQNLVLPTQLPGDVTQKRMIGNPTFTPDGKQITGGSGVTYSLKDMGGQNTPYTTTEVAGVKGGPTSTPPPTESLDSILANNRSAQGSSTPTSNARGATNVSTYSIPNAKLLAQSGGQSDSLPGAINPEDKIPGVYYPTPLPTPNTPTPTNPVVKNSISKTPEVAPDMTQIQQMDINNLNDTIDKLQIKQSKEQLSDEELLTLRRATRQLQQSMTPQSLTGGSDEMIAKKEANIIETTNKLDKQNEQELAQFKQSQEAYKQSEIQAIEQADEEQKKTLGYILGAQGAGTSSFGAEQRNKITQNSLQKKQVLAQAVQAKIDLYGSQLRKDSQETIQTLQTNLDNLYMKAAEFDVENIKELNAFNKEQGANKIKEIDDMLAFAQQQKRLAQPLTEAEKQQANAFAANLYDNEGNFDDKTFELLQKINPKLAMEAVLQGGSIQKERLSNDLAMKGLDADIKRAQLNKLLNPDKPDETFTYDDNGDGTYTAKGNRGTFKIVDSSGGVITSKTKSGVPISQAIETALEKCKNGAQCGKFVNDVLETVGYGRMVQDSYESKVQAIDKIGVANTIDDVATGSVFTYPVKGSVNGHIGIVTGKNPDGTINIMDYNYKGDEKQRERTNVNPSEIFNLGGSISKPIVVDSTVGGNIQNNPSGKKQLPAGNASEIGAMRTAIDQTKNLSSIIDKYKKEMGPIAGNIGKINKFDTDAQTANAEFNRITQIIGKSLEGGKLAEGDIKRYLEMLPNITDNPEVAKNKLASSQQYLNDLYAGQVKSLGEAGYNVKDFYKGIEQPSNQSQTTTTTTGGGRRQG